MMANCDMLCEVADVTLLCIDTEQRSVKRPFCGLCSVTWLNLVLQITLQTVMFYMLACTCSLQN